MTGVGRRKRRARAVLTVTQPLLRNASRGSGAPTLLQVPPPELSSAASMPNLLEDTGPR